MEVARRKTYRWWAIHNVQNGFLCVCVRMCLRVVICHRVLFLILCHPMSLCAFGTDRSTTHEFISTQRLSHLLLLSAGPRPHYYWDQIQYIAVAFPSVFRQIPHFNLWNRHLKPEFENFAKEQFWLILFWWVLFTWPKEMDQFIT